MKSGKDLDNLALNRFEEACHRYGATMERFYPRDVHRIAQGEFDAVLIRADTGGRNMTYAVARLAELNGVPVLDHSESIAVCCNKIHMGRKVQAAGVPTPPTRYLLKSDAKTIAPEALFEELGSPLVLKAPISAFSAFVEKVDTPEEYRKTATRLLRLTDGLVVQRFTPTRFDWRVVLLGGRVLSVARYHIPGGAWKVRDLVVDPERPEAKAHKEWGKVEGVKLSHAPKELIKVAKEGGAAIGNSLYGCDVKETDDGFLLIEVNDNPTLYPGYEDQEAPHLWDDIVRHLLEGHP